LYGTQLGGVILYFYNNTIANILTLLNFEVNSWTIDMVYDKTL